MDVGSLISNAITKFFADILNQMTNTFADTLADIMGVAVKVLEMPLVENGVFYAQILALTLLVVKGMADTISTYILHKNGDPDADPKGLVIGVAQAVAVISTMPWIVKQVFVFGLKVSQDVANIGVGQTGIADVNLLLSTFLLSGGLLGVLYGLFMVIAFLIVAIQATIRGAEIALMSVIGPVMALNLSSANTNLWSAWFKHLLVLTLSQALQIFMLKGTLSMLTNQAISGGGILLVFGWIWVTIKTPKFVQQFAHSTGFTGAVAGGAKQAGSMYLMRKMMTKV